LERLVLFSGGSTIIEAPNQPGWTRLKKKKRREERSREEWIEKKWDGDG